MTRRLPILAVLAGLALATPVSAQAAPEGAEKDMWCGFAFTIVPGTLPADAPEEQKAMAAQMTFDGALLLDRATAAYVEAGFTEAQITELKTALEPKVATQIEGSGDQADYSYDECVALVPQPEPVAQ